jgi:hypothetical protein
MFVLVGQFCQTDANPEKDIPPDAPYFAFSFKTKKEAEEWPGGYWYPNSMILEVSPPPD